MLKLRNAVLTALLAFCLAMPFVSCSFNDVATVDVSDKVKVQSGNNQNGGNENPSGGDSGTDEPGTDEPGTEYPGTEYPGTDEPDYGDEIVYTIMYSGAEITTIPESGLSFYVDTFGLVAGDDYTISETTITLTESGFNKLSGAGE